MDRLTSLITPMAPPPLSIVVPVLNEAASIGSRLAALAPLRARGAELIVVDGGSTDGTATLAAVHADRVVRAPRGRASQLNAGAALARAPHLLFLHADTALPPQADALVARALAGAVWGRFDVTIAGRHPALPLVAALMNRRSRWSGIATGDQAMFVRRRAWEALGGFAPLPLMEDIDLSARLLARHGPPVCLRERVTTDGRRWDAQGAWRTIALMWRLRAAWALGADAASLARRYGYRPRAGAAVAVMAKAPVPGLAKTRLAPLLGAAGAARAQRALLLHTLRTARDASLGPLTLWSAPDVRHPLFRALNRRFGVPLRPQPEGDLGARLAAVAQAHFTGPAAGPVLIVGTDAPALSAADLQAAADALASHDAVLTPAEDGGYVLIGLARPVAGVFDGIDWSTERVAAQTRDRLRAAGARWAELPARWDVDTPADWVRYTGWLRARAG